MPDTIPVSIHEERSDWGAGRELRGVRHETRKYHNLQDVLVEFRWTWTVKCSRCGWWDEVRTRPEAVAILGAHTYDECCTIAREAHEEAQFERARDLMDRDR